MYSYIYIYIQAIYTHVWLSKIWVLFAATVSLRALRVQFAVPGLSALGRVGRRISGTHKLQQHHQHNWGSFSPSLASWGREG